MCTTSIGFGAASLLAATLFIVSLATLALSRWNFATLEGDIRGLSSYHVNPCGEPFKLIHESCHLMTRFMVAGFTTDSQPSCNDHYSCDFAGRPRTVESLGGVVAADHGDCSEIGAGMLKVV